MYNDKILNIANTAQQKAIKHPLAPLMIIAGAGTGKTFTLESRIVYMIKKHNVDPSNILTITYTEKAARELKARTIKNVGNEAQAMFVGTFHSFCYLIIKNFVKNNNLSTLIDQSEAIHMLLNRYDDLHPFESDEFSMNPKTSVIDSFIPFFNRIRDELIDLNHINLNELEAHYKDNLELFYQIKDLLRIYPIFQKWKKEQNLIDYNDMITHAFHYLKNDHLLLKEIQDKYKHIIIDEFQDNNFALNEIVRLIAGKEQSITVVGDDDQVIYSFRGANSYNISTFHNTYANHPKYKSITLEKNYRSSQTILDLANQSISKNVDRIEKKLISNKNNKGVKPIRFWGEKPEQLDFIINEIIKLKNNYSYKDIAILCRTHSQSVQVIEYLDKYGMPNKSPRRGLFSIPAVKDLVSWMQIIGKGNSENIALYRILRNNCGDKIAHDIFTKYSSRSEISIFDIIKKELKDICSTIIMPF